VVAGHGYAYWLARDWQSSYSTSPTANPCETLTANGQRVADLGWLAPGTPAYTCSEPAGRPVYVPELSSECSTFAGNHQGFGTTGADLQRCARTGFKGAKATATIDGNPVDVSKLAVATAPFRVFASKNNGFGVPPGRALSAAYGYGLLLHDLSKGTHTIHTVTSIGTFRRNFIFTVEVL
jgi:hypothetical protein